MFYGYNKLVTVLGFMEPIRNWSALIIIVPRRRYTNSVVRKTKQKNAKETIGFQR